MIVDVEPGMSFCAKRKQELERTKRKSLTSHRRLYRHRQTQERAGRPLMPHLRALTKIVVIPLKPPRRVMSG
jgi:hypothetical protein